MKPPTSEDITRQLQQAHFPQKHDRDLAMATVGDTPMVVTLEQLQPYELNPRVVRNPLYDDIKASIRERGLDQSPAITRRPNERHFIIRNGGNTRLSILGELWQETREERFSVSIACSALGSRSHMPCSGTWPRVTCTAS